MTRYVTAEDIRKVPFKTVLIEVSTGLLADLLGQRFTGPDGVVSMEQVDLRFDPALEAIIAEPVIVNVSAHEYFKHGGDCIGCQK